MEITQIQLAVQTPVVNQPSQVVVDMIGVSFSCRVFIDVDSNVIPIGLECYIALWYDEETMFMIFVFQYELVAEAYQSTDGRVWINGHSTKLFGLDRGRACHVVEN